MRFNNSIITQNNSSAGLLSSHSQKLSQSILKLTNQSSESSTKQRRNQYIANQRRQNLLAINNDFLVQRTSSFSVPLLMDTINTFFQATQCMEEEITLPSRLKDIPVDRKIKLSKFFLIFFSFLIALAFDNTVQPDSWHEIYSFIRDTRNQLRCIYPFGEDNDQYNSKERPGEDVSNGKRIIISNQDNIPFSSASSHEYEQISKPSTATSYDTIKDELKYHYYGLFRSLDNLTSIANGVTEKYREEYVF